jgi:outer membrane protein assembly factor BamB
MPAECDFRQLAGVEEYNWGMRVAGAWLLVVAMVGCAGPEAPPPVWTWATKDGESARATKIEPAGGGRLVAIRFRELAAFIEMFEGDGGIVWTRILAPGEGRVHPYSLAVGDDGMIYVAGTFMGSVSFGDDSATLSTQTCEWRDDPRCQEAFIAAYDQAGEFKWVWRTAGTEVGEIHNVAAVPGGVIFAVEFWRRMPPTLNEIPAPTSWRLGSFVARLDAAGNEVWRYDDPVPFDLPSGGYRYGSVRDVEIDTDGNVLLMVGYTIEEPGELLRAEFSLVKLTDQGEEAWRRNVDVGLMTLAPNGDLIIAGGIAWGSVEQVGSYSAYVQRYDGDTGDLRWRTFLGDMQVGEVVASDVAIDPAGDVVILGFMAGMGPITVGDMTIEGSGINDLFIARLSGEDGWPLDAGTFGFPGADGGNSLVVLDRDDMIVAGSFRGELSVDGEVRLPPPNAWGAFIHRGDPFAVPPPLTQ